MWRLNTLLNNQWVKEEIERETLSYKISYNNKRKNILQQTKMETQQNLRDVPEEVLTGIFIVINVYIKKKNQINNITLSLKELKK